MDFTTVITAAVKCVDEEESIALRRKAEAAINLANDQTKIKATAEIVLEGIKQVARLTGLRDFYTVEEFEGIIEIKTKILLTGSGSRGQGKKGWLTVKVRSNEISLITLDNGDILLVTEEGHTDKNIENVIGIVAECATRAGLIPSNAPPFLAC